MEGAIEQAAAEPPTGERFDPALMNGHLIEAEHMVRYVWASQFAKGHRVLDAACGTGYGTKLMAAAGAAEAVGVDRDEKVLAAAGADAPEQVRFESGDLLSLPFEDEAFDLVVCFEAIEHVTEPEAVLDQLARVVTRDGLVIVSTPNRDVYTPGNPFHLRELTPSELETELAQRFRSVSLRRQHTWIASAVFDDEGFTAGGDEAIEDVDLLKLRGNTTGEETYTLGLASNGELPVGRRAVSLTDDLDLREWSARLDAAELALSTGAAGSGNPQAEVELLRRELDVLRGELETGEKELARLTGIEGKLEEAKAGLQTYNELAARHDELAARHAEMTSSWAWRVKGLLRRVKARLRASKRS